MKKEFKRVKTGEEPVLHVHRYIVVIHTEDKAGNYKACYKYCVNLKEVAALRESLKLHQLVDVFKAQHNFHESWVRVK